MEDKIDQLIDQMQEVNETLRYRFSRPLIRVDKKVLAGIYIVLDIAFKAFVVWVILR